jgi:hypothetical protein
MRTLLMVLFWWCAVAVVIRALWLGCSSEKEWVIGRGSIALGMLIGVGWMLWAAVLLWGKP